MDNTFFIKKQIVFFFLFFVTMNLNAQVSRYWISSSLYQNNFSTSPEINSWNLVEDNGTGSWGSSGISGNGILVMDDATGFFANRLFNETAGVPNLLPLDAVNGVVEFQVVKLTGGNQRFFLQVQEFQSNGTYVAQQNILPAQNTVGYFTINMSAFTWNPLTTQLRFIIGGENYSGIQGTIEFNYFSYYNSNRNWSNTANWSTSSGGVGGASIPLATDTAVFDGSGLGNGVLDVPVSVAKLNLQSGYTANVLHGASVLNIGSGKAILDGGTLVGGAGDINVEDIIVNGASVYSSSGVMNVKGDFSILGGNFDHNNGTVFFNGSSLQQINCTALDAMNDIFIDNVSGVSMSGGNLICEGILTLQQGVFSTNMDTINIGMSGQLVEASINPSSFVTGFVKSSRDIGTSSGTQSFGGIGVTVTETSLPSNFTKVVRETGVSFSVGVTSIQRYFDIIPTFNAGLNASLSFSYFDNELNGLTESALFLYNAPLPFNPIVPSWTKESTSIVTPLSNRIDIAGVTSLSRYTAAEDTPLSTERLKLSAVVVGDKVRLGWSKKTMQNTNLYSIEKSLDGVYFSELYSVKVVEEEVDNCLFDSIVDGIVYYRLQCSSEEGVVTYSNIVKVEFATALDFHVFQNENFELVVKIYGLGSNTSSIELFDNSGKRWCVIAVEEQSFARIVIPIANISSGLYTLVVKDGEYYKSKKVFVK